MRIFIRLCLYFIIVQLVCTAFYPLIDHAGAAEETFFGPSSDPSPFFAGGNGSPGNPFQISNLTELQNMSANLSVHYVLINDIDASNTTTWNWNGTLYNGFIPVANDTDPGTSGFQGVNFSGSFDGQGYNITDLFLDYTTDDYIGLFGRTNSSAVIKNVNLLNYTVFGDYYVGSLIGYNNGGTITRTNTSGTINVPGLYDSDTHYLGGLIGFNNGMLTHCIAKGDINNTGENAGGITGWNDGMVTNCISYVNVTGFIDGGGSKGGLIGYNEYGTVKNSTAYGYVIGYYDIGGLIGTSDKIVINCTAYGDVTGGLQFGGLIGMNIGPVTDSRSYGNVYSSGIGSEYNVGGLIGGNGGTVTNCSSYGDTFGNQDVGGLIGLNDGTIINCSSYGNTTGTDGDCYAVGGLIGWHMDETVYGCNAYGDVYAPGTYSAVVGGLIGGNEKGTIKDCRSLGNTIGEGAVGGIIGYNKGTGVVIACSSEGNTSGVEDVGGLIGYNDIGPVENCTAYGNTTGDVDVGGLIGLNDIGTIENCTTYGNTVGYYDVGGIIGYNEGTVSNSVAYGSVKGSSVYTGGVIGENYGSVTSCISFNFTNGTIGVGGVVGWNLQGSVSNCTAYGDVNGTWAVGGIVGDNLATVIDSTAFGDITGEYQLGGLIGSSNSDAVVINCTAFGNITGSDDYSWEIGGLIGWQAGSVTNSNAFGNVYGTFLWIGGLMGYNEGPVTNCNAYGDVNGPTADYVGGLIGENGWRVINSTAIGNVTGDSYVGGLNGISYWEIINSTARGNVTGNLYVGGLIGFNMWDVTDSSAYGDTNVNGTDSDFAGGLIGYNDDFGLVSGSSAFGAVNGNETSSDNVGGLVGYNYYEINNCTAVGNTTGNNNIGGLVGTNSGLIKDSNSSGNTVGNNSVGGLVGNNSGTITNCSANGNTTGITNVGGLVGYNSGTVGCSSNGTTTGKDHVGGLIGYNSVSGTMTNSISYGTTYGDNFTGGSLGSNNGLATTSSAFGSVNGNNNTGGFAGNNSGIIENCFSTGKASGVNNTGGFVGNNSGGSIKYCYSIGNASGISGIGGFAGVNSGTISSGFWDNMTSGLNISDGGTGRNTTEMMTRATFLSAGFDFTGIWAIVEGNNYPFFGFVYAPPEIITQVLDPATEDTFYSFNITADYSKKLAGNKLEWNITTNATGWLSFDGNGTISGTPSNVDIGKYWVNVTITDILGRYDNTNFTLEVSNINNAPVFDSTPVTTANEDELYTYDANATDIDPGDILVYNLTTAPENMTINRTTGVINWTPVNEQVGSNNVVVNVTDNEGANATQVFSIIVSNVNDIPIITSSPITTATEELLYTYDVNATDVDVGDSLTFILMIKPANMTINSTTGVISWTPVNEQVGVHNVVVNVTDKAGANATQAFSINVSFINDAPIIISSPITTATEELLYTYDVNATDVDVGDNLTFTLVTKPANMTINSTTGVINWTPVNEQVGIHNVEVNVTDQAGENDTQSFSITVSNVNDVPIITSSPITVATEELLYTYDVNATDVDVGDNLTFTLVTKPANMTINSTTGVISWTPVNEQVGIHNVVVNVTDKTGANATQPFSITVSNFNNVPTITSSPLTTASEDLLYTYDVDATDIDVGDTLTFILITKPANMTIASSTGVISWTPVNEQVGLHDVKVEVSDKAGENDTQSFKITVSNTNDAPEIISTAITSATEEVLYTYDVDAVDVDAGDTLTYSLTTITAGMTINSATGLISWTPTNDQVGNNNVVVKVTDQLNAVDTQPFSIMVANVNDAPIITSNPITTATEDDLYTYDVSAVDVDSGDILTYVLDTKPVGMTISSTTGVISWTPGNEHVGSNDVEVNVSDLDGEFDSQAFAIIVSNVNDAPAITSSPVTSEIEDELYTYDVIAADVDTSDVLSFSLIKNPMGMTIHSTTGKIAWTPTNDQVGSHDVVVMVKDLAKELDTQSYTISVGNTNDAPEIVTMDKSIAKVGVEYYVDYYATDIDPTTDTLTWTLDTNASDWLSIGKFTGVLSGTPSSSDPGSYWLNVTVSDGKGGIDSHYFILIVQPEPIIPFDNEDPIIDPEDVTSATVGKLYHVDYNATDDRTPITELDWEMDTNATWLKFDAGTGVLSGTPAITDVGTYWVVIFVKDDDGGSAERDFVITVNKPIEISNNPPVLTNAKITPGSGTTDTKFMFSVNYYDEDGDIPATIKVVIGGNEFDMSLGEGEDASNGIYLFTTNLEKGKHNYYFKTNDGTIDVKSGIDTTSIIIDEAEDPPGTSKTDPKDQEGSTKWLLYLIPVIIAIIIIILIFFFIIRKKPKVETDMDNDPADIGVQTPAGAPPPVPEVDQTNIPPAQDPYEYQFR